MTAPGLRIGWRRSSSLNASGSRASASAASSRQLAGPASSAPTSVKRVPASFSTGCAPAAERAAANVPDSLSTVARRMLPVSIVAQRTPRARGRGVPPYGTKPRTFASAELMIRCATSEFGERVNMKITAAVVDKKSAPFKLRDLELEAPRSDEILVRIVATGICQTDLHVREQEYPVPLPAVLGHEGAGVVEAVGATVHSVGPGDHVILSYQACGRCRPCLQGSYSYCERAVEANFGGARLDGSNGLRHNGAGPDVHGHSLGHSSFATYSLATERNVVKVPGDVPLELLGPLGCGLPTGA